MIWNLSVREICPIFAKIVVKWVSNTRKIFQSQGHSWFFKTTPTTLQNLHLFWCRKLGENPPIKTVFQFDHPFSQRNIVPLKNSRDFFETTFEFNFKDFERKKSESWIVMNCSAVIALHDWWFIIINTGCYLPKALLAFYRTPIYRWLVSHPDYFQMFEQTFIFRHAIPKIVNVHNAM